MGFLFSVGLSSSYFTALNLTNQICFESISHASSLFLYSEGGLMIDPPDYIKYGYSVSLSALVI